MLRDICSITLAAGSSSRMPEDMRPKACCKIGARTVMENWLNVYEAVGVRLHTVVVGHAAEEVMAEVARKRRDVLFAFQPRPLGTGDAVACALDLLAGTVAPEHVLISAADKVVAPSVIRALLETYEAFECDLCLAAGPSESYPDSGRIIERDGLVQSILETPDIHARRLARYLHAVTDTDRPRTVAELSKSVEEFFPNSAKLRRCMPDLFRILSGPPEAHLEWSAILKASSTLTEDFVLPCGTVSAAEAAAAPLANVFVYAAGFQALRSAVRKLGTDNVQGERYLTDIARIMTEDGRQVRFLRIGDPHHVMSFNTLPQLEEVRRVHAAQSLESRPPIAVNRWANYLKDKPGTDLLREAVSKLAEVAGADRPAILVRSPGRINLMGRHVDHQGGVCNLMAIDREIAMAAAPRDDDRINLWNTDDAAYPSRSFRIGELAETVDWEDWMATLDTQFIRRAVSMSAGDWGNYVKGAALRLQHRFRDRKLRGMDACVCGNVPVAAGLSSSSALLVAAAEAMIELNALNVRLSEFVDLCGEGEWFVGTRGGSADHAAIKHGRESQLVSVSFFPFRILGHHPFPSDCRLIVCHSGQSAKKTENARERFNARVACYHMARETIKKKFPTLAAKILHLRDVNMRNLEMSLPALYALLKRLPNAVAANEVETMARLHPTVEKCLAGVDAGRNEFPLRDMALYGLAECERAALTGELLDRGDLERLGTMMRISHDGDRVAAWRPDQAPFDSHATDEHMDALIRKSSSLTPLVEVGAALWQQPGAYDCSTPEIDLMVDTVAGCPGVIGAQLSGAGLGGCIMILVREDAADAVQKTLREKYYAPRSVEPRMFVCRPSRGSHVITTLDAQS